MRGVSTRARQAAREPQTRGAAAAHTATRREVAQMLGVCERTISRYLLAGLPHVRLRNGRPRFDLDEVRAWCTRPVASWRLHAAVCVHCGYAVHIEERFADVKLPDCPSCGAGPLAFVELGA